MIGLFCLSTIIWLACAILCPPDVPFGAIFFSFLAHISGGMLAGLASNEDDLPSDLSFMSDIFSGGFRCMVTTGGMALSGGFLGMSGAPVEGGILTVCSFIFGLAADGAGARRR